MSGIIYNSALTNFTNFRNVVDDNKEPEDNHAVPIYRHHISDVVKAYSMIGNGECSMRILSILTAYQSCARSGEAEFANLDRAEYDSLVQSVFFKIPQEKVDKWKVCCPSTVQVLSKSCIHLPEDRTSCL